MLTSSQVEPVGRFRFRDPTPRQTVHARDAAARTKARQHHAHTSTHLHKARDEVEGDGYAPEPAVHPRPSAEADIRVGRAESPAS